MTAFPDLTADLGGWQDQVRGRLQTNADMSRITWFQVGGPAQLLFQPADEDDLCFFLANLPPEIAVTVIGVGSNLLVRDGGIPGVVIRLSMKGFGGLALKEENLILAGSAVLDKRMAAFALEQGLDGFAFYHGIPGVLGGALRMNAGANGRETCEALQEVIAVDRSGNRHTLGVEEMGYTYRKAGVSADLIFTQGLFKGVNADKANIQEKMDAVQHHRETVQPIREKTGGSTFKNPQNGSAWKEVDQAGCRGLTIGDAQMSEMHCNFMINRGAASAADLERLGETVRARVLARSGTRLEWEIKRIGIQKEDIEINAFEDYGV